MKKNLLICGASIILVIVTFLYTNNYVNGKTTAAATSSQSGTSQGLIPSPADIQISPAPNPEKAIDFTLKDLNGNEVSLSDLKGKNVYLNFFATWCPACRTELPDLEKLYQKYKDKDLVILAVDLGEDKDTVKSFLQMNHYNFNAVLDSDQSVAEKYNISAIPVSIFIDKSGNILAQKVGALSGDEMELYVTMLLGN